MPCLESSGVPVASFVMPVASFGVPVSSFAVPLWASFLLLFVLLGVLSRYNFRGETIFYRMIKRNPTKKILRFLDEESSSLDIIKIIISMRSIYFVKVFIKSLFKRVL